MASDNSKTNWEKIVEMTGDPHTVCVTHQRACEFYWKVDGVRRVVVVPDYATVAPWALRYTEETLERIKQAIDLANGVATE